MATKDESATGRQQVEFDDFDTDELLAEIEAEDPTFGDGQADPGNGPTADEAVTATTEGEPPASPGPDVESAADDQPAGDEPASEDEAPTAPSENTPPAGTDDARPFTFNVDRQEVQVEGAFIMPPAPGDPEGTEDMIVIPVSVFQRKMLPSMAHRPTFQRQLRAKDIEIEELKTARGQREAQAETLLNHLNELYEDPDRLTVFLQNFNAEAPEIRAKAENARLAAENDELRRGRLTPEQRIEQEEREATELADGLEHWVTTLANPAELEKLVGAEAAADFKGVKLDLVGIYQTLMQPELRDVVFVTATEDNPALGVEKGKRAVNLGVVLNLMRREAALVRRLGKQTKEVVEVARSNAAAVSGGARRAHPATSTAGGSPDPSPPQRQEPKNRQEWLDSLERDD